MMQESIPTATDQKPAQGRDRSDRQRPNTVSRVLSLSLLIAASLLLGGCPEDPMGPDNRMALIALGHCNYQQALQLTDMALERGDAYQIQRAWMLKAAILRDQGEVAAAEAVYPELEAAWQTAKKNDLKTSRRERDIDILIDIAQNERRANGLAVDCRQ